MDVESIPALGRRRAFAVECRVGATRPPYQFHLLGGTVENLDLLSVSLVLGDGDVEQGLARGTGKSCFSLPSPRGDLLRPVLPPHRIVTSIHFKARTVKAFVLSKLHLGRRRSVRFNVGYKK